MRNIRYTNDGLIVHLSRIQSSPSALNDAGSLFFFFDGFIPISFSSLLISTSSLRLLPCLVTLSCKRFLALLATVIVSFCLLYNDNISNSIPYYSTKP